MQTAEKKQTVWLYYNGNPLTSVRIREYATEQEIRQKAIAELEAVPGVVCDRHTAPCEQRVKIWNARIKYFPNG